jgi:coenzyme F420 hydrogenase subunit beta
MVRMHTVHDVAEQQMCTGCGVCAYLAPGDVRMADVLDHGRRPLPVLPSNRDSAGAAAALRSCPGATLAHDNLAAQPGEIAELRPLWGPVRALWEGWAADPEIRFAGSSGGAATALAIFAIERLGMAGLLHIGARADVPYLNEAQYSRTRAEILAAAGSRYAPASPCERLDLVESAPAPSVFIGKPCDVAAASMAARERPRLAEQLGLTIGIFCAGTPSTRGTLEMLKVMGVDDPAKVTSVRYRGQGWPGRARATADGDQPGLDRSLSYEQSWGDILQRHRQWRCYLCADHTGEFADIAVGDPWHTPPSGDDPGRSLVLARTERGQRIVEEAIRAGVLTLKPVPANILPASQPNLIKARGAVWGRVRTLRATGQAAPRFRRLPMAGAWVRDLTVKEKLRSTAGTVRRIGRRKLWRPVPLDEYDPKSGGQS